jgi:hypothetical protein
MWCGRMAVGPCATIAPQTGACCYGAVGKKGTTGCLLRSKGSARSPRSQWRSRCLRLRRQQRPRGSRSRSPCPVTSWLHLFATRRSQSRTVRSRRTIWSTRMAPARTTPRPAPQARSRPTGTPVPLPIGYVHAARCRRRAGHERMRCGRALGRRPPSTSAKSEWIAQYDLDLQERSATRHLSLQQRPSVGNGPRGAAAAAAQPEKKKIVKKKPASANGPQKPGDRT